MLWAAVIAKGRAFVGLLHALQHQATDAQFLSRSRGGVPLKLISKALLSIEILVGALQS